ncbi:MAG: hypothetical protein ACE5GX_16740 [Thermoanaerobaculia bacterium]
MKSAYEIALERLERQGIEKPSVEALSEADRARVAEIRQKAQAAIAQLEILHRDRLSKLSDPQARQKEEEDYLIERRRIEERCERDVRKLRES